MPAWHNLVMRSPGNIRVYEYVSQTLFERGCFLRDFPVQIRATAFFTMKKLLTMGNHDLSDLVGKITPLELRKWIKYIKKNALEIPKKSDPWNYLAGEKEEQEKKRYTKN